ncbi:MAG: RNA polymerase sigma-54 factor, partial [Rhodospirillaceae bacterium]
MALTPRLDLRQSQSLVITPQLQQAIKLLQLSAVELAAFVEQELQSNPLLEVDEGGEASALAEGAGNADDRPDDDVSVIDAVDGVEETPFDMDVSSADDDGTFDAEGATDQSDSSLWTSSGSESGAPDLEQTLADTPDLRNHLIQQLNLAVTKPADRFIGIFLIDQLDESGYLQLDIESAAAQLGAEAAEVARVLNMLQQFDPAGIFARDLKECLRLQLADRDRLDPAMAAFIMNIELLADRELSKLREACGVNMEDLQDMIAEVRALNPKPALQFDLPVNAAVIPDVIMSARADGSWRVELNTDTLPRVLVNRSYVA